MVSLTVEGPPPPDPDAKQTPGKSNAHFVQSPPWFFFTLQDESSGQYRSLERNKSVVNLSSFLREPLHV